MCAGCGVGREYMETVLSAQFRCEPESALKIKFIIKQTNEQTGDRPDVAG